MTKLVLKNYQNYIYYHGIFLTPTVARPNSASIIKQPDVEMFPVGLNLDLVCRVDLISAVDSPVNISSVWSRDGIPVVSDGVINTKDLQTTGTHLESVLEFRPITEVGNNTTFRCGITIVAQIITYISGTSVTVSTNLTVKGTR